MLRRELLLLVRYPADLVGRLVIVYVFFLGIFLGGRAVAPTFVEGSIEALIVGYFMWTAIVGAYSGFAQGILSEAEWGTLEQLFMSSLGVRWTVTTYAVVKIVISVLFSVVVLVSIMATAGTWITFDVLSVLPILALGLLPALGVGLAIGGLALVYKRLSSLFTVLQFAFAGILASPVETYPILKWLPSAQGGYLLRMTVTDGVPLWTMPPADLLILVVTAFGYLGIGYAVFFVFEERARTKGVLGHY